LGAGGFYLMHRGWMDNPAFRDEPYTRAQAWCWLIENANFAAGRIEVKGKTVTVDRGQLRHSLRHLAKLWQWDEARVRRFLGRLESDEMIRCVVDAGQNLITILKYDTYQVRESVGDAPTDAAATQERRSGDAIHKEGKEKKEGVVGDVPAFRVVGPAVFEIIGVTDNPNWLGNYGPVQAWMNAGCDPEMDIYPAVRRLMATRGAQGPPGSLNYFTRAVMQSKADRQAVPSEVSPNARQPTNRPNFRSEPSGPGAAAALLAGLTNRDDAGNDDGRGQAWDGGTGPIVDATFSRVAGS
jgi:hypothetical protein